MDDHDALTLEVGDTVGQVFDAMHWLQEAFDRVIRLPKGLEFTIPIEFEIGYDLGNMRTIKCLDNLNEAGLQNILTGLKKPPSHLRTTSTGQPPPSLAAPCVETCG
jgi:hypothetical protein